MSSLLKYVLKYVFWANVLGTQGGFGLGLFADDGKWPKRVMDLTAAGYILRCVFKKKGRALTAFCMAIALLRFKHASGQEVISVGQWLLRIAAFRTSNIPPVVPTDLMALVIIRYGPWARHIWCKVLGDRLGGIFTIIRPGSSTDYSLAVPCVVIGDAELVREVMTNKITYPTRGHTGFNTLVGMGLLALPTGAAHSQHRRVIGKFLSDKYLRGYARIIREHTSILFDKWLVAAESNTKINAYYDISMLSLDIIMEIGTGERTAETNSQRIPETENVMARDLDWALKDIVIRTASPFYDLLPSPSINAVRSRMDDLFQRLVTRAKSMKPEERADDSVLHALLDAKNDAGLPVLSETEVNEEFKTMRGAGSETVSNTICFMLLLLNQNPEVMAKLRVEVDSHTWEGLVPTFEEAKNLKYATLVMYETLRLFPTVPNFPREAAYDTTLGGYDIPKGSFIFVSQQSLNRDPLVFQDPDSFIPERFQGIGELHPTKPLGVPGKEPFAFCPFGGGPRSCIGQRLAMLEGVCIIASIVKRFDFSLDSEDGDIPVVCDITLGPKKGMPLRVSPRPLLSSN